MLLDVLVLMVVDPELLLLVVEVPLLVVPEPFVETLVVDDPVVELELFEVEPMLLVLPVEAFEVVVEWLVPVEVLVCVPEVVPPLV